MTRNRGTTKVFWGLFIIAACLTAGLAGAETISLPTTGQTLCYGVSGRQIACKGTGQDGEFQAGVALPNPRFGLVGNGCAILDTLTGLMWAQNTTIVEAGDWLSVVKAGVGLNYCSYTDWRAANANELRSLMHAGTNNLYVWLTGRGFKMQNSYYISSTFYENGDTTYPRAWGFNPFDGSLFGGSGPGSDMLITTFYNPWVVRSTPGEGTALARVAGTGQDTCFDANGGVVACLNTGQDGELGKGAAWAVPRYTDNGDGTVTDTFTGLMWAADAMSAGPDPATTPSPTLCATAAKKTWEEALDFVRVCLNSADSPYLGYRDWRLPNKNELASLADRSMNTPALPSSNNPFVNVMDSGSAYPESGGHWSSTTSVRTRTAAWITEMTYGDEIPVPNSRYLYVWPVRGNYWLLTPVVNNAGGSGSGTIVKSPAGVACTTYTSLSPCPSDVWPDGAARYNNAKKVIVSAKPDRYSIFTGWTTDPAGLCPGKGACQVTMSSDITVTANFVSQPTLVVTPTARNFGRVRVGRTAAAAITVVNRINSGRQSLTIDSLSLGGTDADQFVIDTARDRCSGATLAAGRSCSFRLLFQPTSAGIKSASVSVLSSDDPSGTTNVSVLSGTAIAP